VRGCGFRRKATVSSEQVRITHGVQALGAIDRMSWRTRPDYPPVAEHRWEKLLFLHQQVAPDLIRPLVPPELELDLWQDQAWVSIVAFSMPYVRPRWLPKWISCRFHELNVRTYVLHENKPGVYFFSLNANSRLAVWWARRFWKLNYVYAHIEMSPLNSVWRYRCHRPRCPQFEATYKVGPPLGKAKPDSLEFFLVERYLLFAPKDGVVHQARVYHAPYDLYEVQLGLLEDGISPADGLPSMTTDSVLAHYCPRVDVEVFAPREKH